MRFFVFFLICQEMSLDILATAAKAAVTTFMENKPWSTATLLRAGGLMSKALRNLPGTDAEKASVICKTLDTLLDQALAKVGESNETEAIVLAECKKCVDTILPVTLELTFDAAGAFDAAKAEKEVLAVVQSPGFWQSCCGFAVPAQVASAIAGAAAGGVPDVSKLAAAAGVPVPEAVAAALAEVVKAEVPAAADAKAEVAADAKAVQNWSGPADVAVVVPGTEQTPPVESANPPVVLAPPEAPAPSEPAAPAPAPAAPAEPSS
jgi:hypothetical protein